MQIKNHDNVFRRSAREMKNPRTLVICAMLVAVKLTLDALNLRIVLTPHLRISFGFITGAMGGMLFGPVPAMMIGGAGDLVGYFINTGGGPYFPGFTITAILAGLIWGVGFYGKKITFVRALLTKGTINIFLNILLNSLWMKLLYNKGMLLELPLRIFKNLAMLPLEALILVALGKVVQEAYKRSKGPSN
ncbi:MAG: folate family ECF transporter S component [Angelakisella sp.]